MGVIVEARDLVVGDSAPFSLGVGAREIVGLLFPPGRPRTPILRVISGLEAAGGGEVSFPSGRVALATRGVLLFDALSAQPDLVVLDAADDTMNRNEWALIAAERALGTSFLVATANIDLACHGDRVLMASWNMRELSSAMAELMRQMKSQTQEFLTVFGEGQQRRSGSLAADLRRLNVGARALVAEMYRRARGRDEIVVTHAAEKEVASVALNDSLLGTVIAKAQDN